MSGLISELTDNDWTDTAKRVKLMILEVKKIREENDRDAPLKNGPLEVEERRKEKKG